MGIKHAASRDREFRGRCVLGALQVTTSATTAADRSSRADAYYCEMPSDPCAIVMFGASGDLARRKLLPALFDLAWHSCLAPSFRLVGFARTPMSDDDFRKRAQESLPKDSPGSGDAPGDRRGDFLKHLCYFAGNYDDPEAYARLAARLAELDREGGLAGNRLFYLATPPEVYPKIIGQLGRTGLARPAAEKSWTRIIIEKPFGRDLASARALNEQVLRVFDEKQVYRIDHYLGKETVQNLLVFRFGNGIFEPLWNRNYIDHVQITAAESLGVENRAEFYESAGALRDMVQSHMLQLTSLIAMEPPAAFDATSVRNEKLKVLQAARPFTREAVARAVVRGQYGAGGAGGVFLPGYRGEPRVRPDSRTETFVALALHIDNWRWSGVPFYLRTGKRLAKSRTEVAIQFKQAPHKVFRGPQPQPNSLAIGIQPREAISLSFGAKPPGPEMALQSVTMDFEYRRAFGGVTRDAYATLINDCIRGEATLFDRADTVEAAWTLIDPVLAAWREEPPPAFPNYPAGAEGPAAAEALIAADGRAWRGLNEE